MCVSQFKKLAEKRLKAGIQRSLSTGAITMHTIECANDVSWLIWLCSVPGAYDRRTQPDIMVDASNAAVTVKCANVPSIPVEITSALGQVQDQRQLGVCKKNLSHTFQITLPSEGLCFWNSLRYTFSDQSIFVAVMLRAVAKSGKLKFSVTTSKWSTAGDDVKSANDVPQLEADVDAINVPDGIVDELICNSDTDPSMLWLGWTRISMVTDVASSSAASDSETWICSSNNCGNTNPVTQSRSDVTGSITCTR
jgi:hypothetical protein